MTWQAKTGIAALILFLIVGAYIQYGTLGSILEAGDFWIGSIATILLFGRFGFVVLAIDLMERGHWFGWLGIIGSVGVAFIECALVWNHAGVTQVYSYRFFALGFIGVSLLIELMLAFYYTAKGAERRKAQEEAQKKQEREAKRKGKELDRNSKPEVVSYRNGSLDGKIAELLIRKPGITQQEVAEHFGISTRTVRKKESWKNRAQ